MPVVSRQSRNGFADAAQEARGIAHEVLHWLGEITESIKKQLTEQQTLYVQKVMNTGADTAVEDTIGPPPGVLWNIKRIAITGAVNGGFAVYRNEVQPQNLIDGNFDNTAMAAFDTDLEALPGDRLILRFFSQPNNQICTVNIRVVETAIDE